MKLATVAFYAFALGLLAVGLRELLTGFEENRCSMTYMFEYPEYRRVALPRRVARQYPAYGLYLYGEGLYAQETRELKLTGAPVLFLPGNAGSYKQARSLGSVALRKAENMEGGLHFNVFTVDFNEELVALYGGSLLRQTHFLHESVKAILRLYKHLKIPPQNVVLVGHSMGGVVARALFTLPRFNTNLVSLIITQASPHLAPVLALDPYLQVNKLRNVTVLSVGGGYRDYQVRSGLTALPCPSGDPNKLSVVATAVPRTWVSTDHLSIVCCVYVLVFQVQRACSCHCQGAYQAFRINVASQCKVHKDRLSNVYRLKVPWFREDSFTIVSVPSVTEISGMLHTSRPDNTSDVLLQLHTAPNCQYKVSIKTSLPRVLGQILRFCGPMVPVYTAATLLLAYGGQLSSILKSRRAANMGQVVAKGLQPHKVNLPVYILHILLSYSWFQEVWSILWLPHVDALPPTFPDIAFHRDTPVEEWPHILSPLIYILGAAVAYWGSTVLSLIIRLISLILAPLHRPSVSRDCGTLRLESQVFITLCLTVIGLTSCGALSIFAAFLFHLYRRNGTGNGCLCLTYLVILCRYSVQLDPDPCWPHTVPLIIVYMLLINCNTLKLCGSKLLPLTSCLPLPLAVTMVTFSPLHLYRVTYFLLAQELCNQ
uniref:GPI inositol-deacylase n=1 Tax=Anabas testudineus TaxID=64144 RepID=A0A3Q1I2Y5_ANATE